MEANVRHKLAAELLRCLDDITTTSTRPSRARQQELQRQERTAGKEGEVTAAESPSPMRRRDGSKRSEGRARLELALRRAARG